MALQSFHDAQALGQPGHQPLTPQVAQVVRAQRRHQSQRQVRR